MTKIFDPDKGDRLISLAEILAILSAGVDGVPIGQATPALGAFTDLSLSGYANWSSADALTALAGGAQAGTAITKQVSRFTTVASAGDSAQLPAAAPGRWRVVANDAAANAMALFPATGDQINLLGVNAALSIAGAGGIAFLYSTVANKWNAIVFSPSQADHLFSAASNTSGFTATAAQVAGAAEVVLDLTGALGAGANIQMPTAAQIVAAIPNAQVGKSYKLRMNNRSAGAFAWTVTTNTGLTLTGTMTIAQNTYRDFHVKVTALGTPAVTLQSIGQVAMTAL